MDLIAKVGLLLLVMAVLYLLAQSFSEPKDSLAFVPSPVPELKPSLDAVPEEAVVEPRSLKDVTIQNYGFTKIDLRTGPEDPADFFDELHVQFFYRDRGGIAGVSDRQTFTVCTPQGIAGKMKSEGFVSLIPDGYIVVERYDVSVILDTVLDLTTGETLLQQPAMSQDPLHPA